uniref:Uncharacterized protein n=1 Tax=Globisporangium ultimum (strain ATCC 200006 / CBS 805.95 / DAOM BR144) TaxID=431595 RepID=K3X171_GLOUD
MLPELASVFAAQESAMENVVSLLTTQVANLVQGNERHVHHVASLEATQQQLQDALLTLRQAFDALADQQNAAQKGASETVAALQYALDAQQQQLQSVETKSQALDAHIEAMGVDEQFSAVETKMNALLEQRLLEMSNRSHLQAQRTEESMKADLESLEKKFEYLSRVKMDVKELSKKIDKQDQTLDDMRVGMELLAKSIGTDESDDDAGENEESNEDRDTKPIRAISKNDMHDVMKRISQSSADILAKINAASQAEVPVVVDEPPPPARPMSEQQAVFTRSRTMDVAPHSRAKDLLEPRLAVTSRSEDAGNNAVDFVEPLPSIRDSRENGEIVPDTPASIIEVAEGAPKPEPDDQVQEQETGDVPEATPAVTDDASAESPEDAIEVSDTPLLPPSAANSSRSFTLDENLPSPHEEGIDDIPVPLISDKVVPEEAPEDDAADEETDRVVEILPQTSRPRITSRDKPFGDADPFRESPFANPVPVMQHMSTAPNLDVHFPAVTASTTLIRSRRVTRSFKRQSSMRKESMDSSRSETMRTPMAKDIIKELWRRMFTRLVQLKRLQLINGVNPDRIFRKTNMSVGARIKRLEETMTDLEDMADILEGSIQTNSQSVQTLSNAIAQTQLGLTMKAEALEAAQTMHGQMIVGIEEKLDLMELDLRRVRNSSNRRESTQSAPNSALTAQHFELAARVHDHMTAFQSIEKIVHQLVETDFPTLATRFDTTIHDFRSEIEHKSRELAKDLYRSLGRLQEKQDTSEMTLSRRMNAFIDRLYRDLLSMTRAHLVSVEMVKSVRTTLESSPLQKNNQKKSALFDVSLEMLQTVLTNFENECRSAQGDGDSSAADTFGVLLERSVNFQDELEKLKEQSKKAKGSAISDSESSTNSSSSFVDRLVLLTTAQLKSLESLLVHSEASQDGDDESMAMTTENTDYMNHIRDLVVQLRSILSLLFLQAELLDPHQKLHAIVLTQNEMNHEIKAHNFALSQLGSIEATVKMMNSRVNSFLEMSITFAKDEDVKKSIQEMLNSSDSVRDNLASQLESTYAEAQKRDEILEHELTQLVSRVNKKLDKDELLWTQEILERQLQSVAKSSLGDEDLVDIHRLLRNKLDKSYFNALLLEQQNRNMNQSGGAGGNAAEGYGVPGNAPLIGTKCISCNSELPPTKAMIKSVVKDEVHQEVAKTMARSHVQHPQPGVATASSSFNVSTHRSMEKHKRDVMLAALQQKNQMKK